MCYSVMMEADLDRLGWDWIEDWPDSGVFRNWLSSNGLADQKVALGGERVYPHYWTAVLLANGRQYPMRYSAYPPEYIPPEKARALTAFNARRDSLLKPFWQQGFGQRHGIVAISGFYEWVAVEDLLAAGQVGIGDIEAEFERQKEQRRQDWVQRGKDPKKLRPTKAERTPTRERRVVIRFSRQESGVLAVPVIFTTAASGLNGFAIVTDDPTPEILKAGHDRMPLSLSLEQAQQWLRPETSSSQALLRLLREAGADAPSYQHSLVNS